MRKIVAGLAGLIDREDVVFLAGSGLMTAGAWHWSQGAGLIVGGVMLIVWLGASRSGGSGTGKTS